MWTPVTRRQHSRTGLRYETDVTDAEWALIEPLLPPPPKCGRPRFWPMREIMNAIFYVLRGGIAWRLLPRAPRPASHNPPLRNPWLRARIDSAPGAFFVSRRVSRT
jgi:transposase